MLTVAQLFDSSQNGIIVGAYLDVCRSAIRILLTCISKENKDVSHFDFVGQGVMSALASKGEERVFLAYDIHNLSGFHTGGGKRGYPPSRLCNNYIT